MFVRMIIAARAAFAAQYPFLVQFHITKIRANEPFGARTGKP